MIKNFCEFQLNSKFEVSLHLKCQMSYYFIPCVTKLNNFNNGV